MKMILEKYVYEDGKHIFTYHYNFHEDGCSWAKVISEDLKTVTFEPERVNNEESKHIIEELKKNFRFDRYKAKLGKLKHLEPYQIQLWNGGKKIGLAHLKGITEIKIT